MRSRPTFEHIHDSEVWAGAKCSSPEREAERFACEFMIRGEVLGHHACVVPDVPYGNVNVPQAAQR